MAQNTMNACNWEIVHGFESPDEYRRFCSWLMAQVDAGLVEIEQVTASSDDLISGLEEHWYRCKESGETWRVVAPEAPFRGFWGPIQSGLA
ncbi:hypothetical protein [Cupriavidus pampae]|uniref:hypothetical protein n=1 Tax=Cupriavidus pampae TaxID=659251 RepID=UPI001CC4B3BD|nr:hypothetical protein [Cupriavidus pampae]